LWTLCVAVLEWGPALQVCLSGTLDPDSASREPGLCEGMSILPRDRGMSLMRKYRVTFIASGGTLKGIVTLSEIVEAEDLETAFHNAKDWAEREGWMLKAVEEVRE